MHCCCYAKCDKGADPFYNLSVSNFSGEIFNISQYIYWFIKLVDAHIIQMVAHRFIFQQLMFDKAVFFPFLLMHQSFSSLVLLSLLRWNLIHRHDYGGIIRLINCVLFLISCIYTWLNDTMISLYHSKRAFTALLIKYTVYK